MINYLDNILRVFSQLVNVIFLLGDSQESLSARCWREQWKFSIKVINAVYFWQNNHCRGAYAKYITWATQYIK